MHDAYVRIAEENVDALMARTPAELRVGVVTKFSYRLCDVAGRTLFERLFKDRAAALENGKAVYAKRLAAIDQCIELRKFHAPSIATWLSEGPP